METLEQIQRSKTKSKPYPKAVRVKVVKIKENIENCVEVAVADQTGYVKAVCYDGAASQLMEDGSFLIRQFIRGTSGVLVVNKHSRITRCAALQHISPEILQMAEKVVSLSSGVVCIGDIHTQAASFTGKRLSIEGVIVEDELPRCVKGNKSVRNIKVKDKTGVIQVALWNEKGKSPVKSGDRVKITNVSAEVNDYLKEMSASSTGQTVIEIVVEQVQVEVISVEGSDEQMLLLTCELRGELVEIHMPKPIAVNLWKTDVVDDIMKDLENTKLYDLVLQGRNVTDLGVTDMEKPEKLLPKKC